MWELFEKIIFYKICGAFFKSSKPLSFILAYRSNGLRPFYKRSINIFFYLCGKWFILNLLKLIYFIFLKLKLYLSVADGCFRFTSVKFSIVFIFSLLKNFRFHMIDSVSIEYLKLIMGSIMFL